MSGSIPLLTLCAFMTWTGTVSPSQFQSSPPVFTGKYNVLFLCPDHISLASLHWFTNYRLPYCCHCRHVCINAVAGGS